MKKIDTQGMSGEGGLYFCKAAPNPSDFGPFVKKEYKPFEDEEIKQLQEAFRELLDPL